MTSASAAVEATIVQFREAGFRAAQLNQPEMLTLIGKQAITAMPNNTKHERNLADIAVWHALGKKVPIK